MKRVITFKKGSQYKIFSKEFKDANHQLNYLNFMERRGYKLIGIDHLESEQEIERRSIQSYVQAQEEEYFNNFCRNNNI
jgi:hypothetical protein